MENDDATTLDTGAGSGGQTLTCPNCHMRLSSSTLICPNDGTVIRARMDGQDDLSSKYVFLEEIGAGGMGVVYTAEHILTKRVVAIKLLLADKLTPASIMRFQREAQAASKLSHPNLVTTLDFGLTSQGQPYMVMDYLEGKTLQAIIKEKGQLSLEETRDIFLQICDGLQYAHENNILHRDLKPSNVLILGNKSDRFNVKIVDFGIAKLLNDSKSDLPTLTETGALLGTPLYMSPELVLGKELDIRSDVYSLGCVLYECLSGVTPLSGNNAMETAMKHVNTVPTSLKEASFGREFPDKIESLLKKSLEKDPGQRFPTINEFKAAFVDATGDASIAGEKAAAVGVRNRLFQLIAVSILLIGGLGILVCQIMPKQQLPLVVAAGTTPAQPQEKPNQADTDLETNRDILDSFERIKSTAEGDAAVKNVATQEIKAPMQVTSDMVNAIANNPSVRNLTFKKVAFNDMMLRKIQHMPLHSLTLSATTVTNKGLIYLNPELVKLELEDQNIIDSGVKLLLRLKKLKELHLKGNPISDESIKMISEMKGITNLNIKNDDELTGAVMKYVSKMPLRTLAFDERTVNDQDVVVLSSSPTITTLDCGSASITDRGLEAICKMKLKQLTLDEGRYTDKGLLLVSQMKGLKKFTFLPPSPRHFSEGLKSLSTMPLESLKIRNVLLEPADADVIGRITTLKKLTIEHARLSEAGYKNLRRGLPRCQIIVND